MGRIFTGGFQLRLWLLDVHKHFCQSGWYVVSNLYMVLVIMIWKCIQVTYTCILFHKDSRARIFSFIFFFLFIFYMVSVMMIFIGWTDDVHNCYWIAYKAQGTSYTFKWLSHKLYLFFPIHCSIFKFFFLISKKSVYSKNCFM